ncbi:V-type proton ATPase 16 kDa proteolipid subunit [Spatholobus suberectus]|nr:V-type proton ATPase 16 kDa proteolipid subunit [Spatholobus suberectus]
MLLHMRPEPGLEAHRIKRIGNVGSFDPPNLTFKSSRVQEREIIKGMERRDPTFLHGNRIIETRRSASPKDLNSSDLSDVVADPPTLMAAFSGDETAPFFGFLGAAAALVFSCMGAAYGTAKSGVGVASMGVMRPELVMKSIVPVVMAGVLGIYGLIIAVIISTGINPRPNLITFLMVMHISPLVLPVAWLASLLAWLLVLLVMLVLGRTVQYVSSSFNRQIAANAQQPKLFVGMILILIFAEALALYGLIVGIILSSRAGQSRAE